MDAAIDRVNDDFTRQVEVVRIGSIFARDQKAYKRWSQSTRRAPAHRPKGLTGQALEQAVSNLASMFPDNVIRGTV